MRSREGDAGTVLKGGTKMNLIPKELEMVAYYVAPRIVSVPDDRESFDSEWAIAAAVAAILALPIGIVLAICAICGARSFWTCLNAVLHFFGRGC